jgi:uncharacterized protein
MSKKSPLLSKGKFNGRSKRIAAKSQATNSRIANRITARTTLAPRILKDIVARVVDVALPDKIILFGSAARGRMGPNSDVDLLIIKGGQFDRGKLTAAIYRSLGGVDAAVDVVIVTPEEVERYRDTPCLLIYPAVREGKIVYGN